MKQLTFDNISLAQELFGQHNDNLARVADGAGVKIDARGNTLTIRGDAPHIAVAETILNQLYELLQTKFSLQPADIEASIKAIIHDPSCRIKEMFLDTIFTTVKKKPITPRNQSQQRYCKAVRHNDIVFAIGPAGTGKTYLAVAMAVAALSRGEVSRIILARPAVEAGEALGFLPGDLAEKINPYLRPLYDALYDMLSFEKAREMIDQGTIEIAPLAFMRGRTLNNAFIILDEAQNTTSQQMKMFLTRMGFSSQAVITGDITQIDLPTGKTSGLVEAKALLHQIEDLKFIFFTKADVVRHQLVSRIIDAYEKQ
jgi:phosphate starvation-inducible PhoH-like protein